MSRYRYAGSLIVLLLGCSHSDTFAPIVPTVAAPPVSPDVLLTYNADQDYWPIWSEDGQGILYAYVDPGPNVTHRCVGLLPPAGGTRIWSMCHNEIRYNDSVSSFTAYALGSDGRLLYTEAVAPLVPGIPAPSQATPSEITLWLADSAKPFTRTALLTLPTNIGGTAVNWLSDMAWTGSTTFIALGQNFTVFRHCFGTGFPADPACDYSDSVFSTGGAPAGAVIRGTISGDHATLTVVTGTDGATGYSVAENGASIVFTKRNDGALYKVPASGGVATIVVSYVPSPFRLGYQLLGVSCRGTTCIAATDSVTLSQLEPTTIYPVLRGGSRELRSISLVTGTSSSVPGVAGTQVYSGVVSVPTVSPISGDVVVQVGGAWGHLQTFQGSGPSDLHLLRGLVP
jgi:hypothetical protein